LIIQNIRKSPETFIKNVINIYGCDNSGLRKLESALNNIFNIDIQLPIAQHCVAGNNPQPEAVQESVNKVLKTLNEAIEKKK
jgi:Ni,Fe-hydrogenase III small subunit